MHQGIFFGNLHSLIESDLELIATLLLLGKLFVQLIIMGLQFFRLLPKVYILIFHGLNPVVRQLQISLQLIQLLVHVLDFSGERFLTIEPFFQDALSVDQRIVRNDALT